MDAISRKDSNFIFRSILPQAKDGKIEFHFAEPSGLNYQIKLLSRRPDSLQRIDIIPTAVISKRALPINRMNDINLQQQDSYFTFTFDLEMLKTYDYVKLFFEQFKGANKSDLVLLVYRK